MSTWLKQTKNKPLFENLLWSQPENKALAGKLLIIGGHSGGLKAPGIAYSQAEQAGIGSQRVILPQSLRSSLSSILPEAYFVPSNKNGSFSRQALAEFLDHANWADLVFLAGDFGNNSETAILIEQFVSKYKGLLCLAGDSLSPFLTSPKVILNRPQTVLVITLGALQKYWRKSHAATAITSSMSLLQLMDLLADASELYPVGIITLFQENYLVAINGKVSYTNADQLLEGWTTIYGAYASVRWLQNPNKAFEALTSSVYQSTYTYGT